VTDVIVDDYTLYHIALAIRARRTVLDHGGSIVTADDAFFNLLWMAYSPENTIATLDEHPNLNAQLIPLLEAKFELATLEKTAAPELEAARKRYEEMSENYEFLRMMTAPDALGLIISK
jgi:hypothetical protein